MSDCQECRWYRRVSLVVLAFAIMLQAFGIYRLVVQPLQKEIQHLERQLQHERAKEPQSIVFRI